MKLIDQAKQEARQAHFEYHCIADKHQHDCGMHMLASIVPGLGMAARRFNAAMRSLKVLDPKCPKFVPYPEG